MKGYVLDNLTARFEHIRVVVLTAEAHAPHAPVLMFSEPMAMNAHEWRKAREEGFGIYVLPNGGMTRCLLYNGDEQVAYADVRCSDSDNYVKALGRIKSLGKATSVLKAMA